MLSVINKILDWFRSLFWKEEMELTLVGLQCSGKTTFVNVIAVSFVRKINSFFLLFYLHNGYYQFFHPIYDSRNFPPRKQYLSIYFKLVPAGVLI